MPREISYAKALNEALTEEMDRDPSIIVLGEDVGAFGGAFTVTGGLYDRFGSERVIDTPISEAGFVGLGVGSAMAGLRPVVELMFVEFSLPAADQLLNQATKMAFLSGGEASVPLTVRTQQGAGGGGGPQHSQSMESLFTQVPGLAVAMPATPYDAKGLLTAAIREDYPTVVIEHKALYFTKGDVPEGEVVVPLGSGVVRRRGTDITLIAYSRAVQWALKAADELLKDYGISAEVVDLRSVVPLDEDLLVHSVEQTGRALVVQEAPAFASVASELCARIAERCWASLKAPLARVCGLSMPVPFAANLEERWLPSSDDVVSAAVQLVRT